MLINRAVFILRLRISGQHLREIDECQGGPYRSRMVKPVNMTTYSEEYLVAVVNTNIASIAQAALSKMSGY